MKALAQTIYEDYSLRIKELFAKGEMELTHAGIAVEVGSNLTNYWQEFKAVTIRDDYE